MTDPVRDQLLGHLLGALEDSEQSELEARLKHDSKLRRKSSLLKRRLELLSAARTDFDPPPGLAQRTARLVASTTAAQRRPMSPETAPPSRIGRFSFQDAAVAACVLVAASLLIFPAINYSRFQSRLITCQDRLRQLGAAMKQYAGQHDDYFPQIPTSGKTSVAGIYAPMLRDDDLLKDVQWIICPGSELAGQEPFRVPSVGELRSAPPERLVQVRRWLGGSYGYCLGYMRNGRYHPTRDLNRSNFVLMADAPGSLPGLQSTNHGGRGQNVLFEDAHVEFVTSSRPFEQADDFYANDLGQVAAGIHRDDSVIGSGTSPPIVYVSGGR